MTPDASVELANVVRKSIKIVNCNFPGSLLSIYVANIHERRPPVFLYVQQYYKYTCIYIPCIVESSQVILRGRFLI